MKILNAEIKEVKCNDIFSCEIEGVIVFGIAQFVYFDCVYEYEINEDGVTVEIESDNCIFYLGQGFKCKIGGSWHNSIFDIVNEDIDEVISDLKFKQLEKWHNEASI